MSSAKTQTEFTLWLSHRQNKLMRAARTICFDSQNAEDVLQEALIDVYERWEKVSKHDNPDAYVIRVMVSKHIDIRRKWARRRDEKETTFDLPEEVFQIADQSEDVIQRLLVQSALKSLSGMQRAVLVLTYEYGFTLREVAKVLQIPAGTAASHLARGKAAVGAHIGLMPELERSFKKQIGSLIDVKELGDIEVDWAEVVDSE